ncbi:ParB N-terminal domain-containing protein [Trinickia sp.]|uniref:ParB N-terminal domain-containing protein n=1 Tax=Trinickia sp. TaxID=2571163 RepID=UPI003F7DC986
MHTQLGPWAVELIATERILPNEEHDEARLLDVLNSIERAGRWTAPIVLERASLAVMDGHHRLAAAKRLSLPRVPCVLLDYGQVGVQTRRPEFQVDATQIVARSLARMLYPPKTTRHIFPSPLPPCNIELAVLTSTSGVDWRCGSGRSAVRG